MIAAFFLGVTITVDAGGNTK